MPSAAAGSPLRVYVYEMPSEFTTALLQYRGVHSAPHRETNVYGASQLVQGSLYAMETALHEWLLDSRLRTADTAQAHLFFVPVYVSSLYLWPIHGASTAPLYGGRRHRGATRVQQATLMLRAAAEYVRSALPFWNASGGADHVWMLLHDEAPCFAPRELRPSLLLTHYGYDARRPLSWSSYADDDWLRSPAFYEEHVGPLAGPREGKREGRPAGGRPRGGAACFERGKDLVLPPWKPPSFWRAPLSDPGLAAPGRRRGTYLFFAGELGAKRLPGYSHDLRQRAEALFCDPREPRPRRDCLEHAAGCRSDLAPNCSLWRPGVRVVPHVRRGGYGAALSDSTYCLALPGDGWSSRVLDAVVHGCVPVIVQDESAMFFEGAFSLAGAPELEYSSFSLRLPEAELPRVLEALDAVAAPRLRAMQAAALRVRDYFVYKDVYAPYRYERKALLATGRPRQDGFLLLALALEARARQLGKLPPQTEEGRRRNRALLELDGGALGEWQSPVREY